MTALIAIGVIGGVALVLIYWALAFCARESGAAGKALAAVLGVAITGMVGVGTYVCMLLVGYAACGPDCSL